MTKLIYLFVHLLINYISCSDHYKILRSKLDNPNDFFSNEMELMRKFSKEFYSRSNNVFDSFLIDQKKSEHFTSKKHEDIHIIKNKSELSTSTNSKNDINLIIVPIEKNYLFKIDESIYIYGIVLILLTIMIIIVKLIMLYSKRRLGRNSTKNIVEINDNSDFEDVIFDIRYLNDLKEINQHSSTKPRDKNLDCLNFIRIDSKKKIEEKTLHKFQNSKFQHNV
jgi:hypothetical protein